MIPNPFKKPLEAARTKISEYVDLKLEEAKLTAIEKSSPIAASVVIGAIMLTLCLISFVFIGMALAYVFAHLTGSEIWGYLICAGIFILFLFILGLAFKPLKRTIAKLIAKALADNL